MPTKYKRLSPNTFERIKAANIEVIEQKTKKLVSLIPRFLLLFIVVLSCLLITIISIRFALTI